MDYQKEANSLVKNYIKPQVKNDRIIQAFLKIPRHNFVPPYLSDKAYIDIALPIGNGQTISQPSLVAIMTKFLKLKANEKVLEIGTGSGFQTAILSCLAKEVYSTEIIPKLARTARKNLDSLAIKNVHIEIANGTFGLPKYSPYDAIIVTAGAKEIPKTLVIQLKDGGRLVIPVGALKNQTLIVGIKRKGKLIAQQLESVRFVPLIGEYGWKK